MDAVVVSQGRVRLPPPTPSSGSTAYAQTAYAVYNSSTQTLCVLLFNLAFTADSAVSVTGQLGVTSRG